MPSHLYYVMFELLKNSVVATVPRAEGDHVLFPPPPPLPARASRLFVL